MVAVLEGATTPMGQPRQRCLVSLVVSRLRGADIRVGTSPSLVLEGFVTTDEAREAAWREWYRIAKHQPFLENVETGFNAGWNARGQHDKEQIAAARRDFDTLNRFVRAVTADVETHPAVCQCIVCVALRALADQSAEATG